MIKQTFIEGKLDKSTDERMFPKGFMRDLLNGRVSEGLLGDVGTIKNCLGNEALTDLNLGTNAITIGADKYVGLNKIYWLTKSDDRCCFLEHDIETGVTVKVLEDTRVGDANVLNFHEDFLVDRIVIIEDSDNDAIYATWTDNRNFIPFVNIERAKAYGVDNFRQEEISLIKLPPPRKPNISMLDSGNSENNISEKFLVFSYRYKYLDGEYSALAPFSAPQFFPKSFQYDFATNSNESMVNFYNELLISVYTGSDLVTEIEIVYKESNNSTVYKTEGYVKADEGWPDYSDRSVTFKNNVIHQVLPEDELSRLFDNVPYKAGAIEYIGNQIMLGDYVENFNLINPLGDKIVADLSLGVVSTTGTSGEAHESVKTIRDYEAGLVYADAWGRICGVITSENGTVYVSGENCDKKNRLQLTINHLAPAMADSFRVFIKQSRESYDILTPSRFYEDNTFRWIRLDNAESDKIKEGDYLIVKADTQRILPDYKETRVIEIADQERNFLETEDPPSEETFQEAGRYYKIKPDGFSINLADYLQWEMRGFAWGLGYDILTGESNHIESVASFYGLISGLDDLTPSGAYTGTTQDIRYIIEIDTAGATDTFIWSDDDGVSFSAPTAITGAAQALSNGVEITFGATTGHEETDNWIVSAKGSNADFFGSDFGRTHLFLSSWDGDIIEANASITLYYNQWSSSADFRDSETFTASRRYNNIEEWYYGDNIDQSDFGLAMNTVWFRRGVVTQSPAGNFYTEDLTKPMNMVILSQGASGGGVKSEGTLSITQNSGGTPIIFETKSIENNSDIFWELEETYICTNNNGWHIGAFQNGDTNQDAVTPATLNLPFFNCFGWYNGFESYKIKDQFNAKFMGIQTRPWTTIPNFKENRRKSSITYSGVFEQTTSYNALNEFNPSLNNFIALDDAYGSIQRLHSRDTDLLVVQENRLQPLGYRKSQIQDKNGNVSVVQNDNVLNIYKAYSGEYGISLNPEGFAFFGNRVYMPDARRGTPIRLSIDGVTELSPYGLIGFFREVFTQYPNAKYQGAYDPYNDEYILSVQTQSLGAFTIGFSERVKGWTGRYSFVPERMVGINNRFYSFKAGQLYLHDSDNVPRNNFYGVQYTTKVVTILNDSPSNDKIFKSIVQESNRPWATTILTNLANSTIAISEFVEKESRYFAYVRNNEDQTNLRGNVAQGVGNLVSFSGNTVTFNSVPVEASIGDSLMDGSVEPPVLLGAIASITGNVITLDALLVTPTEGIFCFVLKNARIEGGDIRGYFAEVTLETENTEYTELFAVNAHISRSDLYSKE